MQDSTASGGPAGRNEVRSLHRVVKLRTAPPEGCSHQALLVPVGATDQQVLAWAQECLDEASFAELRAIIDAEAETGEQPCE